MFFISKQFTHNFKTRLKFLFSLLVVAFVLPYCSSKKTVKIEKLEHTVGASFSIDTINVVASKEDVAWKITSDQFWLLIDSQLQFGSKEFLFNVLDNSDTVEREARIFVTGQDVDTVFIKLKQYKGSVGLVKNQPNVEVSASDNRQSTKSSKSSKKILIEEQPVEDISGSEGTAGTTGAVAASASKTKKEKKEESGSADSQDEKTKIELSVDQVTLGAANNLLGNQVTIDANTAWKINANTIPKWLSVVSVADGKVLTEGSGGTNIKFKTKEANTESVVREAVVEFQAGKLIKTIQVAQKPTEADIVLEPSTLKLSGEPEEQGSEVRLKSINTQWTITSPIPDWLKINPSKGNAGQSSISIKALNNETPNVRQATITIVSTGETIKKELTITQEMQSVKIQVTAMLDALGSKAESFSTFTVNSTTEWQIVKNEEVTWYDVDVTNGTGGEDNVETVTVTAVENNPDIERVDTLYVVSKSVKKKVVVIQRGAKLKPVSLSVNVDTIDYDVDLLETKNAPIAITCNDRWSIKGLPNWLVAIGQVSKQPLTGGYGDEKIELKLDDPKDSIKASKLQSFTIQSDLDPTVKKIIFIKSKLAVAKKEISVTGLSSGVYIPYLEIGNISKSVSKSTTIPTSTTFSVYASVDFIIKEDANKESTQESFFVMKVDKEDYVLGDVIPSGNHEITITAQGDNIIEPSRSKIKILTFVVEGEMLPFKDNSNNKQDVLQFQIKQEPFVLDESKPKILVDQINFNGYNSYVLLGNPSVKKAADTEKTESPKKTVKLKTNKPITLNMVEDLTPFFNVYYGSSPDKANTSYKLGKIINPGEYYFSFESKKNYTDPNGFKSRQTLTLFFQSAVESKTKNPEEGEDQSPNLMFIDLKNRDYSGLHFRTEFLIEQESL